MSSKSMKRISFLKDIIDAMKHNEIFGVLNYRKKNENEIKQFMYPKILDSLSKYYVNEKNLFETNARKKAIETLLWEGNVKTVVNNFVLFGVQHRPDMIINNGDISVAIEIKKGDNGSSIRSGIGQSLIYSQVFDFVIYLFIDTSKTKNILNSINGKNENNIINKLWSDYNIIFEVV